MDSSEDLQQIQIIFDPCIRSSGNDTTPILVLFACGCANSCQQILSKTSISLNRAGCSDPLSSYVSRTIKGWICHLRYDPVLMTLITVCCLCTALHYQADGSAWVSASYRAFPQTSITQCKWDWNQRMAYCGFHQKGPKSSGNIWRVGLSNSHKFKKLVFASRWAIKELTCILPEVSWSQRIERKCFHWKSYSFSNKICSLKQSLIASSSYSASLSIYQAGTCFFKPLSFPCLCSPACLRSLKLVFSFPDNTWCTGTLILFKMPGFSLVFSYCSLCKQHPQHV